MQVKQIAAVVLLWSGCVLRAQDFASLTVTVLDPGTKSVPGAKLTLRNLSRGTTVQGETNETGAAVFDFLAPGEYALDIVKSGFETYHNTQMVLNVRDRRMLRVELKVAAAPGTTVEVTDQAEAISSDLAQGISLDQRYVENLPANGRSAESLILMTPGISSATGGGGGFNANGLRDNTNYFTLDGVSLNRPMGGGGGGGPMGGGPPAATPGAGSSTEMISIDAMQEMKVQTSSFAPEFGRTPGAQVVMSSRSGSNGVHSTLFYYGRRQQFDANDWFANSRSLRRGAEKQDRAGGVLGGPVIKNRLFVFLSFEKLKLLSPESIVAEVPDLATRKSVSAALQPYLNVFPLPNGASLGSGAAEYTAIVSNPSKNYSASLRMDYMLSSRTNLFARYSLSPSNADQRGSQQSAPNVVTGQSSHSQTVTAGMTHAFNQGTINDLRLSYSVSSAGGASIMDNYGGAVPLTDALVFPSGVTSATGSFNLSIMGLASYSYGSSSANNQQQVNVVDNLTKTWRTHNFKFGLDYRDILQTMYRKPYTASVSFDGLVSGSSTYYFTNGVALNGQIASNLTAVYPTYANVSAFAQDTWRWTQRATLTYGLRWDLNPAPTTRKGPRPFALADSDIAGVTQNEPIYPTRRFDLAPRVGVSYLSDDAPGREMTFRTGVGIFYDLGYGTISGAFNGAPYSSVRTLSEVSFPFSEQNLVAPALPATRPYGQVVTAAADLSSPMVLQWNGTLDKNLGTGQTLSIGLAVTRGINLMRTETSPSANSSAYQVLSAITNGGSSWYHGLQLQFRKRLSDRLQTQWSYTWAHSIDDSSSDSGMGGGFASLYGGGQRGSSDYDIRHNLNFSGSWQLYSTGRGGIAEVLRHWYLDFVLSARSGLPFDIEGVSCSTSSSTSATSSSSTTCSSSSSSSSATGLFAQVRPNYDGKPVWVSDPTVPGGRRLNRAAFTMPTSYEQGNLGRNTLRGFSFGQLDLSLRRMIPVGERLQIHVAAEGYNVLNKPNFANPTRFEGANMSSPKFGVATEMMNESFGGGVNALYRSGGARSMELSVRVQF